MLNVLAEVFGVFASIPFAVLLLMICLLILYKNNLPLIINIPFMLILMVISIVIGLQFIMESITLFDRYEGLEKFYSLIPILAWFGAILGFEKIIYSYDPEEPVIEARSFELKIIDFWFMAVVNLSYLLVLIGGYLMIVSIGNYIQIN